MQRAWELTAPAPPSPDITCGIGRAASCVGGVVALQCCRRHGVADARPGRGARCGATRRWSVLVDLGALVDDLDRGVEQRSEELDVCSGTNDLAACTPPDGPVEHRAGGLVGAVAEHKRVSA